MWVGADDFLLGVNTNPDDVVANIIKGIKRLYWRGARIFLVANLPELCALTLPEGGVAPGCGAEPTGSQQFNAALASALRDLSGAKAFGRGTFALVNIYDAAENLFSGSPPLPGPAAGCLFSLPTNPELCGPEVTGITSDMLWPDATYMGTLWDEEHPATWVHQIIGDLMAEALANEWAAAQQ